MPNRLGERAASSSGGGSSLRDRVLAGVSKRSTILGEIDNDERRMKELGLMTRKLAHSFVILDSLGDEPGHNRARLGEA